MENIMEKEPTLIEQKFEDAVKNFRQEMEKGKGKFSFCGEIERSVSGKQVLVQVYERYYLYPNICATATFFFEELEEEKTTITYILSSYGFGVMGIDFGVSSSMKREIEKRINAIRFM
jgi:hypothetical protein